MCKDESGLGTLREDSARLAQNFIFRAAQKGGFWKAFTESKGNKHLGGLGLGHSRGSKETQGGSVRPPGPSAYARGLQCHCPAPSKTQTRVKTIQCFTSPALLCGERGSGDWGQAVGSIGVLGLAGAEGLWPSPPQSSAASELGAGWLLKVLLNFGFSHGCSGPCGLP